MQYSSAIYQASKLFSIILVCMMLGLSFTLTNTAKADEQSAKLCADGQSFLKRRLAGNEIDNICTVYSGKVMLIVNTASKCGFTNQYEGLEKLYETYKEKGLVVLGFPSNDFGGQEPGSEKQIREFCVNTYAVRFPMYEKTRVSGDGIDPLYQSLISASGSKPRWNFHKYLVAPDGALVDSWSSRVEPNAPEITAAIESVLP